MGFPTRLRSRFAVLNHDSFLAKVDQVTKSVMVTDFVLPDTLSNQLKSSSDLFSAAMNEIKHTMAER